MSRFLRKHFCRLLASAKQAPSQLTQSSHFAKPYSSGFRAHPRNPPSQGLSRTERSSAINVGRRALVARGFLLQHSCFFHVDARGYQHFQRKGFGGPHGRDRTRLYSLILISIGGITVLVYTTHQEVVPYTLRKHCVLISPRYEGTLVDRQFEAVSCCPFLGFK